LLSNCAAAAVQHDPQLKAYYKRKRGEGKGRLVVLNAVGANRTADAVDQPSIRHRQPRDALRADRPIQESRVNSDLEKVISSMVCFYLRIPCGIIKNEYLAHHVVNSVVQAQLVLQQAVFLYNYKRPHMSCDMLVPDQAHQGEGKLKRWWRNYYHKKVMDSILDNEKPD